MNEEIFLITEQLPDDNDIDLTTDVFIFNSLVEANMKLDELTYGEADSTEITIYHGILIQANFIPDKLNGIIPYIYIKNPESKYDISLQYDALFIKAYKDINKITNKIEELLNNKYLFINNNDTLPTIEDVFLFFGTELMPSLQVIDTNIDEELITRALAIKNSISNNLKGI